ncbi:MAG TPA: sigma-54 dependent transcriptional regulator [Luteibaculaceae bacterium]|nr:sigma-54 dependent transcriptional regulator [Luteibaculaceae bacterium]
MKPIVCIDDDPDIGNLLKRFLERNGLETSVAYTAKSGIELIKSIKPGLVLCDFRLPDMEGMEVIKAIKNIDPALPVIIITGYSDVKVAVNAIKHGAIDYVTKPIHPEEILMAVKDAMKAAGPKSPRKTESKAQTDSQHVEGQDQKAQQFHSLINLVAPTDMTVVILGESGTGKEVAAQLIHQKSLRATGPFVAVDCGALSHELAASELFGHKKGAFTGALNDKVGQFEHAHGGTLFLDEIGNLSYENQIKLLRALQERKIRRLGDHQDIAVDVRIVVATNENLKAAVSNGTFREDIYYRINEFALELPPLRERGADILRYAAFFLELSNRELQKSVSGFDDAVLNCFSQYRWPGNLREMKNVIKRATLFAGGGSIALQHLPAELHHSSNGAPAIEEPANDETLDLKIATEKAERSVILKALLKADGKKTRAAELLNIDRKTLYNKMQQLGIDG